MTQPTRNDAPGDGARGHWLRGLYMLLFVVIYNVAEAVAMLLALFQFGHTVITGTTNGRLLTFGRHLSRYIYDILRYLTYASDRRPYPFSPWPDPDGDGVP